MILHYLKVALRNLWKYRTHSLISVLCLAVGITFFTVMSMFVARLGLYRDLPGYEHRAMIRKEIGFLNMGDLERLQAMNMPELEDIIVGAHYSSQAEMTVIDRNGRELPYLAWYRLVNGAYFPGYDFEHIDGNIDLLAEDEVVVTEAFARRIMGEENPIGLTLHKPARAKGEIENFRIVGVVKGENSFNFNFDYDQTEVYFPMSYDKRVPASVEKILKPGVGIREFNERLNSVRTDMSDERSKLSAYLIKDRHSKNIYVESFGYFIASLILLSGIVNFLKFIIQMFYNRQRELAIRKCVGSSTAGTFCLLFAECFCMMTVAGLFSMVLSELCYVFAGYYLPSVVLGSISLPDMYLSNLKVYWVVLVVCMFITLYPVWRMRRATIIHMVMVGTRRHVFRNVMIGVQMAISLFFIGGTCVTGMALNEVIKGGANYLTEEEEGRIILMNINTGTLHKNREAVISEIRTLPEVEAHTVMTHEADGTTWLWPYQHGNASYEISIMVGQPDYFDFFRVPMEGKKVEAEPGSNWIYVSQKFHERLLADSVSGMVNLNNTDYQIAGIYPELYKEKGNKSTIGSAFIVSPNEAKYYIRIHPKADVHDVMDKITSICRKYVPETLPLEIRLLTDKKGTGESIQNSIFYGMMILAFISILVVILSVYSAISMDTVSRQKEVAIRKINGATPKIIAWMFGRTYIITYLIVFLILYPISRSLLIITMGSEFEVVYRLDWPIFLFFGMALLIFLVTAFKIWQIMHINPATIIKKE